MVSACGLPNWWLPGVYVMKCPKCGSEMAFGIKRSERKPRKILYEFMWCTNKWCGHEEKVGGEKDEK